MEFPNDDLTHLTLKAFISIEQKYIVAEGHKDVRIGIIRDFSYNNFDAAACLQIANVHRGNPAINGNTCNANLERMCGSNGRGS